MTHCHHSLLGWAAVKRRRRAGRRLTPFCFAPLSFARGDCATAEIFKETRGLKMRGGMRASGCAQGVGGHALGDRAFTGCRAAAASPGARRGAAERRQTDETLKPFVFCFYHPPSTPYSLPTLSPTSPSQPPTHGGDLHRPRPHPAGLGRLRFHGAHVSENGRGRICGPPRALVFRRREGPRLKGHFWGKESTRDLGEGPSWPG